jgi:hypothetical protein
MVLNDGACHRPWTLSTSGGQFENEKRQTLIIKGVGVFLAR